MAAKKKVIKQGTKWSAERRARHEAKKAARRGRHPFIDKRGAPRISPGPSYMTDQHNRDTVDEEAQALGAVQNDMVALGDTELPIALQVAELRGELRAARERIAALEPKPDRPQEPTVLRVAVQHMIIDSFKGMPDWNAIGTLHRKLIEGLEKL